MTKVRYCHFDRLRVRFKLDADAGALLNLTKNAKGPARKDACSLGETNGKEEKEKEHLKLRIKFLSLYFRVLLSDGPLH